MAMRHVYFELQITLDLESPLICDHSEDAGVICGNITGELMATLDKLQMGYSCNVVGGGEVFTA